MSYSREDIDAAITERIATDPTFREALLADPRAALTALSGMSIPDSIRITVHQESPTDIHLVVPADSTLSETDLELVSGGIDWYSDNHSCVGIPQ